MSPRPRKVSDEDVFAAAQRAMSRLGPADLTLAEIAAEAGVTAGALVQRFGSKRALQLALSARAAVETTGFIDTLQRKHRSPLVALHAYVDCLAGLASSPAALSRNLAYLRDRPDRSGSAETSADPGQSDARGAPPVGCGGSQGRRALT